MLSRFISKSTHLRLLTLISSKPHFVNPNPITHKPLISIPKPYFFPNNPHFFSTGNNNNGNKDSESEPFSSDLWKLSSETEESVFGDDSGASIEDTHFKKSIDDSWGKEEEEGKRGVFDEVGKENSGGGGDAAEEIWATAEGYKAWSFASEGDGEAVFDVGEEVVKVEDGMTGFEVEEKVMSPEEKKQLELEEKALTAVIKGPNRAFGDLIAASGITDEMLDSLMALKDLDGIQGLPPLREIEDMRYEKNTKKSTRADIERQKQEEVAQARVRQVDAKGRAYGTGRRKCSIARVWVEPGDGKFVVNDKEFDVYFPMLDHRAVLLRPFTETKTLGMWDIRCTVKGGGVSGQVGAIQLGIGRALQNWDPELRPPLRKGGLLTRDSRIVERKKPGRAKARKSFQWVKR